MNTDLLMSHLRTFLKSLGIALTTAGYIQSGSHTWEIVSGVITFLVGLGMSQWFHESDNGPFTRFLDAFFKSLPPPPPAPPAALLLFALVLPFAALPFSGCETLKEAVAKPAIKQGIKEAALFAINAGLSALGERVNELQPVTNAIMAKISIPFSEAATPGAAAQVVKDAVASAAATDAQRAQILGEIKSALVKPPAPGVPAAGADEQNFRRDVAAAL